MELSGHLTRTVFEYYQLVSTGDLVKAVERVSATLKKMERPEEKPKEGIIPGVPFRSAEHGGDFTMRQKGKEIFPEEFIHFTKLTEEQRNQYLDYAMKEWGIDYLKEIVKGYQGKAEWEAYAKLAAEKRKGHEQNKE